MTFVSELEPQALWRQFDHILTIPRPSKGEEQMRAYVISEAERLGLSYQVDGAGNVVVSKPGSPGHEDAPTTILQGHLDMVQEKNADVEHDWAADPIQPQMAGEYLKATGTTLGSDNGMALAAMLAILEDKELVHGPIECLFTVDEETGLTGAAQLDAGMLAGRQLINLDSEEEGKLCVGCAGGADTKVILPVESSVAPDGAAVAVKLHGLKGGHSGVDIHLQRGNAIKLLARAIAAARGSGDFRVASLGGGNAHNAIPREAHAVLIMPVDHEAAVVAALEAEFAAMAIEFRPVEPGMALEVSATDAPSESWSADSARKVVDLINALPHGVVSMSYDIPDLVETSTNLATVKQDGGNVVIEMSSRSSVASALEALRSSIKSTGALAGASADEGDGYPGWKPDLDSKVLKVVQGVHQNVLGTDPEVYAVHAGLECGLIGEMIPGMDMISIGPQIEFPHSPDEQVHVESVERFWRLLTGSLTELAKAA